MSIYMSLSRVVDSAESNVAPGALIVAEGQALVRLASNPAAGVQPASGAAVAETFVGFSKAGTSAAPFAEQYATKLQNAIVPTGGTVQLDRTPVAGTVFVFNNTTGAAIPVTGGVSVVGSQVRGLPVAADVTVTYKFAQTVVEARSKAGDVQPGGYIGDYIDQIGLAKRGLIYIDQYDTSVNWAAASQLFLSAGGQITTQDGAGKGLVALNAYIVDVPSVGIPYLGLEFSAA